MLLANVQTVIRLVITEIMLYASSANFSPHQLRTEPRRSPRPMASASNVLLRDSSAEIFKDDALSRVFIPAMFVRGLPSCCSGSQQATKTSATCRGFAKSVENTLATTQQQIQQISAYFTRLKSSFLLRSMLFSCPFFCTAMLDSLQRKCKAARPGGETLFFFFFFLKKKADQLECSAKCCTTSFCFNDHRSAPHYAPSAGGILMNERDH